jgi:hypothetical protein
MGRQPCMFRLFEFNECDIPLARIGSATIDRTSGLTFDGSGSILGIVAVFFGLLFMNPLIYHLIGVGDVLIVDKAGNPTRVRRLYRPDKFMNELAGLLPSTSGGPKTGAMASPASRLNWVIAVGIFLLMGSLVAGGLLLRKFNSTTPRKPPANQQFDSSQNDDHRSGTSNYRASLRVARQIR